MGGFALGNVLSWTSPTQGVLEDKLGTNSWAWVGALMALGAAVAVIPIGYLIDKIGRKYTMLGLVLPFTAGWALIAWADDSVSGIEVNHTCSIHCVCALLFLSVASSSVRCI